MAKKVVNFRYDGDDWELVQTYAKSQKTNVTELITKYLNSLIGKDTSKDSSFTDNSKAAVKILSKDIEDCKDKIESFKIQFIDNQNQTLNEIQNRISELKKTNNDLFKKVNKLSLDSTNKDNLIKKLNNEIDYIKDKVQNIQLSSLSLVELKELAKGNKVKFNSRIAKQDLVKLLIDNKVVN